MIVYFAGVNTNPLCDAFAGLHVLESFADIVSLMDRHRPRFASMCLDSGAYSVMTTGVDISLSDYIAFAKQHGHAYDFVASLDSITGGVKANIQNFVAMRRAGVDAVPTFHSGEPFDLLREYCKRATYIGIGMRRPGGVFPPAEVVRPFLRECFKHIPPTVRVHGWGMTNYTDFPFTSVDSTTWLWEMKALLGVRGQGANAVGCLTPREIVEIVQKKYLRFSKRQNWEGLLP